MRWLFLMVLLRTKPSYDSDVLSNLMLVINLLHQTAQGSIDSHIRHTNKKRNPHAQVTAQKQRYNERTRQYDTHPLIHTPLHVCTRAHKHLRSPIELPSENYLGEL